MIWLFHQKTSERITDGLFLEVSLYDVRSYGYRAVLYKTLIALTVFLAVKQCIFVTMHGGSAVTFLFRKPDFHLYDSVIRQAENDIDAGLYFLQYETFFFLYDVIIIYVRMKSMQ